MEVLIQPLNRLIQVEPGANLLEALRTAQVPMSYSCMAGRCGTCRCKVIDGEVLDDGREQQRPLDGDSYVLACQTYLTGSCTIEIPEPDEVVVHPARIIKATVCGLEDLTHDIKRLVLKPAKPLDHSPGQYVQLQFTPEHVRPYSMAGVALAGGDLEFHVRAVPDGRVTGHVFNQLKLGDAVRVSGPLGTAYLRRKHEGPMLCVAGGTGLAPVLSILRGAVAGGMRNPIHLYFGVRSPRDVYGQEWLLELERAHPGLKVHIIVATGGVPGRDRCGLVTEAIEADLGDLTGWRAYLCGSPPMVESASLVARRKGIAAEHIYADAFYTQGT
ncbi:MAG: 2Fe-2S iron-sulfur cluster-binding protein [Roseateles sp.]|uniref:2Fe-2S iron-sulfur cluster-binding protein n=1 Tax=Roseateles sp. TaxID=1971397 RepID=UPI0039E8EB77